MLIFEKIDESEVEELDVEELESELTLVGLMGMWTALCIIACIRDVCCHCRASGKCK